MEAFAPGLAGASMLALLFVLRAVGSATTTSVTLAGREMHWGCAFKEAFGVPCPTCGMTRSLLLSLHGQITEALSLNPGGPLLVAGGLLFSAAMLALTFNGLRGRTDASAERPPDTVLRRLILSASAYGGLTTVVLLAHWVRVIT